MIVGKEKEIASIKAWLSPDLEHPPEGLLVLTPSALAFWETRFGAWVRGNQLWFASHGAIARIYSWRAGVFFKNRITVQVRRSQVDYTVESVTFRVDGGGGADVFLGQVQRHLSL